MKNIFCFVSIRYKCFLISAIFSVKTQAFHPKFQKYKLIIILYLPSTLFNSVVIIVAFLCSVLWHKWHPFEKQGEC